MYDTIRCEYKWAKSKVKWTGNLYFYDYPYGQLAWSSAQNIDPKNIKISTLDWNWTFSKYKNRKCKNWNVKNEM